MIDSRAGLPQDLAGDSLGLPCARIRPLTKKKSNGLPTVELKVATEEGFHLPGGNADTNPALIAFAGTKPLELKAARARSHGCLRTGGPLDRVLKLRKENDLERLVDVLVRAAPDQRHDALRYFKQPYNAHRAKMAPRYIDEDHRRRLVLQILRKYPLCDIYDLVRVDEKLWANISRELGGLSYGHEICDGSCCRVNDAFGTSDFLGCSWYAAKNYGPGKKCSIRSPRQSALAALMGS
eukprot:symbB.v1.2.022353.t1/scaffold1977.1/size96879/8